MQYRHLSFSTKTRKVRAFKSAHKNPVKMLIIWNGADHINLIPPIMRQQNKLFE
jgi:hypothetical protein